MPDDTSIWTEIIRAAAASATVAAASWGAAGGATSALVIKVSTRDAIRQVAVGALVAGGLGTAAGALVSTWFGFPAQAIPAISAGSAASYMVGVFGPAVFEVLLSRLKRGQLPGDKGGA